MYSSLLQRQSLRSSRRHFSTSKHTEHRRNHCINEIVSSENINTATADRTRVIETVLTRNIGSGEGFRPRMSSQSSQSTVVTTLSKSLSTDMKNEHPRHIVLGRSISTLQRRQYKTRFSEQQFLNKQKHGILRYGMFKLFNRTNKSNFSRQGSVESAASMNTISNSSLQDFDESEFNSSELAHYMEEVNTELT